jgi:phage shock protein C
VTDPTSQQVQSRPAAPTPGPPEPPATASTRPPLRRPDGVVAGVCAGLGRTLGVDPIVFRLLFVGITIAGGAGVVLYVLAWLMIPPDDDPTRTGFGPDSAAITAGTALVVVGGWMLVQRLVPEFAEAVGRVWWPVLLIGAGLLLLLRRQR